MRLSPLPDPQLWSISAAGLSLAAKRGVLFLPLDLLFQIPPLITVAKLPLRLLEATVAGQLNKVRK